METEHHSIDFFSPLSLGLLLMTVYTATVDGLLVTVTVPAVDEFGWTTFSAMERRQISQTVNTTSGEIMTVATTMMSPFRAPQVSQVGRYRPNLL